MTEQLDLIESPAVVDVALVRKSDAIERTAPAEVPAASPSVESLLHLAVQNKVDPANLERLVALFERVQNKRAEQAFNAAMAQFRSECPAILKTSQALDKNNRVMYCFADLSEITKVVDPILFKCGLHYTWDTDVAGDITTVTCTIHHVDGHKRSSKFTCKGSGTAIMNAAQIAASATTFGRRYSLTLALGLTTDLDDDGRRAAPMPAPESDPNAPHVGTREERASAPPDDGVPRVTSDDLNTLYKQWKAKAIAAGDKSANVEKFNAWAQKTLGSPKPLTTARDWSVDALDACREALK